LRTVDNYVFYCVVCFTEKRRKPSGDTLSRLPWKLQVWSSNAGSFKSNIKLFNRRNVVAMKLAEMVSASQLLPKGIGRGEIQRYPTVR